jgi:hypothetical protein
MLGIGWREECALMMIEPPRDVGRTRVFEVDDRVLVAVKLLLIEQRAGAVNEAGKLELGVAANALAIEAGKQSGGRGAIETLVVIKNPNSQ